MFWLALATAIAALITAVVGMYEVIQRLHKVEKIAQADLHNTIQIKHEINSRLTELLELARRAARLEGHQEGVQAERDRQQQGIQGPQGEPGVQGAPGVQGPQGRKGEDEGNQGRRHLHDH